MRVLFFFSLLISLGISCHDEDCLPDNCQNFLIENNITDKITNAHASIVDHEIVDDCLKVTLTVGGCDDDHIHDIDLITTGEINESLPVQIPFYFRDNNPQSCQAIVTLKREFDLSRIRSELGVEGDARLIFQLSQQEILYEQ